MASPSKNPKPAPFKQASVKVQSRAVGARVTIKEPWRLDLPQKIVDHFEQTSALTGIEPSALIAAAIVKHFEANVTDKPG